MVLCGQESSSILSMVGAQLASPEASGHKSCPEEEVWNACGSCSAGSAQDQISGPWRGCRRRDDLKQGSQQLFYIHKIMPVFPRG